MHARLVWGKLKPGMWEEYERDYSAKVVSKSPQAKGFPRATADAGDRGSQ